MMYPFILSNNLFCFKIDPLCATPDRLRWPCLNWGQYIGGSPRFEANLLSDWHTIQGGTLVYHDKTKCYFRLSSKIMALFFARAVPFNLEIR